jgi:ornithine--oxo-acid transaminase
MNFESGGDQHGTFLSAGRIPLLKEHRVLVQVAGHSSHTVKLLPALVLCDEDCNWIEESFEKVIADSHRMSGAVWTLGKTLAENARKAASSRPSLHNHHRSA